MLRCRWGWWWWWWWWWWLEINQSILQRPARVNQRCIQVWRGVFNAAGGSGHDYMTDLLIDRRFSVSVTLNIDNSRPIRPDWKNPSVWSEPPGSSQNEILNLDAIKCPQTNVLTSLFICSLPALVRRLRHNLCAQAAADFPPVTINPFTWSIRYSSCSLFFVFLLINSLF